MKILLVTMGYFITTWALADLEIVAELPRGAEVGNVAVGPDGRIFCSVHKFYGSPVRLIEILPDGQWRPYPNIKWGHEPDHQVSPWAGLNNTLGIQVDSTGVLWMLDNPGPNFPTGRLIGWDTRQESLYRVIYLPEPVLASQVFLNDLAVDRQHQAVYIADTAGGTDAALIVVDLETGLARRLLQGHTSVVAEDLDMVIDDRTISRGGNPARIAINPITVDAAHAWVYYGAMSGTSVYRLRTRDLLDLSLDETTLAQRVERYGEKPISDGITMDNLGNIYITDITANAIGVTQPNGNYRVLYQDDQRLSWPDGFAVGPDNWIYVTVNQLHRSPFLNGGDDASIPPYRVIRLPALGPATVGR